MINIQCPSECPGIGRGPGLYPRRDRERTARHPCKGGLQWGEEISISNVQGKMKSLECAEMAALVWAASCRGGQSGVLPPHSKPGRRGGIFNVQYPMFKGMSGDRTWAGVVSPAGSGENSAPPVQGWPTMGGRDLNVQYPMINVQGKMKSLECADVVAIVWAASCRGGRSGVLPPHSKPGRGGGIFNVQYPMFKGMSGDRTWAGVVSPAGSGENSAPPVQGWPTMGGRDLNIQCSREDEEFGVCGRGRACLGRELSRGTKRRLAAALQTGPAGRGQGRANKM